MAIGECHVVSIEFPTLQCACVLNRDFGEEGSIVEVDDDILRYNQKNVHCLQQSYRFLYILKRHLILQHVV